MLLKYPGTFKPLPKKPNAKIVSVTIGSETMNIK